MSEILSLGQFRASGGWIRQYSDKIYDSHEALRVQRDDLLTALEYVQHALACWRDDKPMPAFGQYKEGQLSFEEVKYCVVDEAILKVKEGEK